MKSKTKQSIIAVAWPIVAYIFGGVVALLLSMLAANFGYASYDSTAYRLVATICSVSIATWIISWGLRRFKWQIDIGLRKFGSKYIAVASVLLIGLLLISYSLDYIYSLTGIVNESSRNTASFGSRSVAELIANFLIAGVLTAWLEELLFRGFMYGGLRKAMSPIAAALITSTIFAMFHLSVVEIPFLFVFSLGLCELRRRSQSILPGMLVHAGFNISVLFLAYIGFQI